MSNFCNKFFNPEPIAPKEIKEVSYFYIKDGAVAILPPNSLPDEKTKLYPQKENGEQTLLLYGLEEIDVRRLFLTFDQATAHMKKLK